MLPARLRALLIGLSALGLSGCALDGGYGGVSVGIGSGGYYDPYYSYDPYYGRSYDPYRYGGLSYPGYGWYRDFYYPGYGAYVFDRAGQRHAMRSIDRHYWLQRRHAARPDDYRQYRKHHPDRVQRDGIHRDRDRADRARRDHDGRQKFASPGRNLERRERRPAVEAQRGWRAEPSQRPRLSAPNGQPRGKMRRPGREGGTVREP